MKNKLKLSSCSA